MLPPRREAALSLLIDAFVLVLGELALLDLLFPAVAVPFGPLAAAQLRGRRLAVPGQAVGLALVLALLVDHHLLVLAARGEAEQRNHEKKRSHDRWPLGCGAGGFAPGLGAGP